MTRRGPRGVLFMLTSSAWFAGMAACVKALSGALPTSQIVFFRCVLPLPYLLWLTRRRGVPVLAHNRPVMALRCAFGAVAMALYFHGLGRMPLADVVLLGKTQPVFVALLAPLFLGERAGAAVVIAVVASLAGAALIVSPGLRLGDPVGLLIVVAA